MAKVTTTIALSDLWTQVAGAGQTYFLQVLRGGSQVYYAYKASTPTAGAVGHVLDLGEILSEVATPAHLWMRSVGGNATVVVSTSGTTGTSATRTTANNALTGTWSQVGAMGEAIHLEATNGVPIRWVYSVAAPGVITVGHVLYPSDEYIDAATDSNLWARADVVDNLTTVQSTLVTTRG